MHAWQHQVVVRAEFLLRCDSTTFRVHKRVKDLLYVIGQPHFLYTNVEAGEGEERLRLWWKAANRVLRVAFQADSGMSFTQLQADDTIGNGLVSLNSEAGREEFRSLLSWLLFDIPS